MNFEEMAQRVRLIRLELEDQNYEGSMLMLRVLRVELEGLIASLPDEDDE